MLKVHGHVPCNETYRREHGNFHVPRKQTYGREHAEHFHLPHVQTLARYIEIFMYLAMNHMVSTWKFP